MDDTERWKALRQYEEQQRQARLAREQKITEERERRQQRVLERQVQQEAERRAIEQQRQAQEVIHPQQSEGLQQIATLAENLHIADQQRNAALQEAKRRAQETEQVKSAGSPIEHAFAEAWRKAHPDIELQRQYPIGRYRVDFAYPETHLIIELDGHQFHSTRKHRNRDYQRQRELEEQGWAFIRFTGSEVVNDVVFCVEAVWKRIQERMER